MDKDLAIMPGAISPPVKISAIPVVVIGLAGNPVIEAVIEM